mgnify:CR=1 FL=1
MVIVLSLLIPVLFVGGFLLGYRSAILVFRKGKELNSEVKQNKIVRMTPLKKELAKLELDDSKKLKGIPINDIKKIDAIRRAHS